MPNNTENTDTTILHDISERTAAIHTTMNYHNERLTKIEEAILQLAATNERVRSMDNVIREIKDHQVAFEKAAWDNFNKMRGEAAQCVEHRTATDLHFGVHDRRIEKVEDWKDDVVSDIKGNTRVRGWVEKGIYVVAVFLVVGIIGSFVVFNQPNKPDPIMLKLDKIEKFIENTHTPLFNDDFQE